MSWHDDLPGWTLLVAALFAPLGVWVLWRLQVLGVELLRWRLTKLLRHATWLYNAVSWFGTFLHEMSHATVLLLSGHGIKQFRVQTDSGHVLPRRVRRGPVGFLFFLAAALAPLFGPPLLALVGLTLLVAPALWPFGTAGLGLGPALDLLQDIFVTFPRQLLTAVARLNLADPWHAAALFVILFGIPGSKPSHVKGSRFHGEKDEGDIAVVRSRIRRNPWPLLGFVVLLLAAYYPLVKWAPAFYWYPFEAVWTVAIAALALSILGAAWWTLVAWNTGVRPLLAWLPPVALVAAQVVPRVTDMDWSIPLINGASVLLYAATALVLRVLTPRRRIGARLGL